MSADLDADGIADLAVAGTQNVAIFVGNGDGTFQLAATFPFDYFTSGLRAADLDGDGLVDLAIVGCGRLQQ